MRIAQLINSLDYGGAEQVVASLAEVQGGQGDHVRLVCLRGLGPQPVDTRALTAAGVQIVQLEKPPGLHPRTVRRLSEYLRSERIEVVHSHNHIVHHYAVAAGRVARVGAIVNTLHGTASLLGSSALSRALFWASCLSGDRVVSVCSAVEAILRSSFRFPPSMLKVIDNGIDLTRFLAIAPRPSGEELTFGMIGRLEPVKDHETLLRAFALLFKRYPNVHLRLLGDGPIRQYLQDLARGLSLEGRVHFEGFSRDTVGFLSKLDAYVVSSRSEGLPLTLLEAMSSSLPVAATAVGGIPDIMRRVGCNWLCPPCNPQELAAVMEQVLLAHDRAAQGARNRRAAAEHYSVERMTRDYNELYRSVLAAKARVR